MPSGFNFMRPLDLFTGNTNINSKGRYILTKILHKNTSVGLGLPQGSGTARRWREPNSLFTDPKQIVLIFFVSVFNFYHFCFS